MQEFGAVSLLCATGHARTHFLSYFRDRLDQQANTAKIRQLELSIDRSATKRVSIVIGWNFIREALTGALTTRANLLLFGCLMI